MRSHRMRTAALVLGLMMGAVPVARAEQAVRASGAYVLPASDRGGAFGAGVSLLSPLTEKAYLELGVGYRELTKKTGRAVSYTDFLGGLQFVVAEDGSVTYSIQTGFALYMASIHNTRASDFLDSPFGLDMALGAQLGAGVDYRPAGRVGAFAALKMHMVAHSRVGTGFLEVAAGLRLRMGD